MENLPVLSVPQVPRKEEGIKEKGHSHGIQAEVLSTHLCAALPEVELELIGCRSLPYQQHSRKTDKKASTPLFTAMVPPVTGGRPSLQSLQLPQPWSPGYAECPGPVTSPPRSDLGSFPITECVLCHGLVTEWLGSELRSCPAWGSFPFVVLLTHSHP